VFALAVLGAVLIALLPSGRKRGGLTGSPAFQKT